MTEGISMDEEISLAQTLRKKTQRAIDLLREEKDPRAQQPLQMLQGYLRELEDEAFIGFLENYERYSNAKTRLMLLKNVGVRP